VPVDEATHNHNQNESSQVAVDNQSMVIRERRHHRNTDAKHSQDQPSRQPVKKNA
jgi:hypothetical protein